MKAYRIWLDRKKAVVAARDVRFIEDVVSKTKIQKSEPGSVEFHTYLRLEKDHHLPSDHQNSLGSHLPAFSTRKNSELKRGPGRPKLKSTGKRGRPRKLYNLVPVQATKNDVA